MKTNATTAAMTFAPRPTAAPNVELYPAKIEAVTRPAVLEISGATGRRTDGPVLQTTPALSRLGLFLVDVDQIKLILILVGRPGMCPLRAAIGIVGIAFGRIFGGGDFRRQGINAR